MSSDSTRDLGAGDCTAAMAHTVPALLRPTALRLSIPDYRLLKHAAAAAAADGEVGLSKSVLSCKQPCQRSVCTDPANLVHDSMIHTTPQ
jgi:hypothetical protein